MTLTTYPFNTILINGRTLTIHSIVSSSVLPLTEFETHTFSFIKQWLTEGDDFSITTSGSTGNPKTIALIRAQMQSSAKMTIKFLGLKENDISLVCLSTQYIAGRMMLVRAFEAGMFIVAQEPSANPLRNITAHIDFMAVVPLQFQTMLAESEHFIAQLNNMKAILIGGASINSTLKEEIKKINSPVFATYGMTETISHIALQKLNGDDATEKYKVLPGIHIQKDERGCLVIHAPYLGHAITTNDLVEITSDNEFQWLGRWDNIINTGGIKIIPEKLETAISFAIKSLGADTNFFVHGIADERLGQKLILVIETEEDINRGKIFSMLSQVLPKYEVPKEIVTIPTFNYTQTGKINRRESMLKIR